MALAWRGSTNIATMMLRDRLGPLSLALILLVVLMVLIGTAVSVPSLAIPLLAAAGIVFVLLSQVYRAWTRRAVIRRFYNTHPGKDLVLVYTDSPTWRSYIEVNWLPKWGARAVTLNRSKPWLPSQPEAELWRLLAGRRDHTPLAIVLPRGGDPIVVRFWPAFLAFKHGKAHELHRAEDRLSAALQTSRP